MHRSAFRPWVIVIAAAAAAFAGGPVMAASWYVSSGAAGGDGSSWSAAWSDLDGIDWGSVAAGDVVYIDGGAGGMTYVGPLEVGAAGTAAGRISIERSVEAGHDGPVTVRASMYVDQPYITIDGKDRGLFLIDDPGGGYIVRVPPNGDFFELRNITLSTTFQDMWGTPFYANSLNVLVSGCSFVGTNNEDQIKYNGGGGTLVIEDSSFTGLTHNGDIHEDVVQFDADNISLVARRNIFVSEGTDCFMIDTDGPMGTLEFAYNIFSGVADAIKVQSAERIDVFNCIFDSCRDILVNDPSPVTVRNCIFAGTGWSSGIVHIPGYDTTHCLWEPGTTEFEEGEGNLQADPLFVDRENLDYHLRAGSPAIDAGLDVGLDRDLDGNPIVGAPDIGAYEYASTPPPDEGMEPSDPPPDAAEDPGVPETPADTAPDTAVDAPPADTASDDAADEGAHEAGEGCGCVLAG